MKPLQLSMSAIVLVTAVTASATTASAASFLSDVATFQFGTDVTSVLDLTSSTIETIDTDVEVEFLPFVDGIVDLGLGPVVIQSQIETTADVGVDTVTFAYDLIASPVPFIGTSTWVISGLDDQNGGLISDLTLTSGDDSFITGTSFTGDSLTVDFDNTLLSAIFEGGTQSFTFAIDTTAAVAPVPLPASLPLLMAGIGAIGWASRRTRR